MQLQIVSWNGNTTINDGTNFTSILLPGSLINLTSQPVYSDSAENFPYLSGSVLAAHSLTLEVIIPAAANIALQRELLKGIFNVLDFQPHYLVVKDTANGNKQWQVSGLVAHVTQDPTHKVDTAFLVTLALAEPVWQVVTVNTDNWLITGTSQQRTITPIGNTFALPSFAITPTTTRPGAYQYARYCRVYSQADKAMPHYPLEITGGGINTATLVNDTTVSNQCNGAVDAVQTTIPINVPVGGGLPNVGMGYVGTEQISWTGNTGGTSLTGVTRGIGGTTAATHLTGAVIARSKMLANGNDLTVQFDGAIVTRSISAPNTASTKIWIAQNWSAAPITAGVAALGVALPNNGTTVDVQLINPSLASALFLRALLASPNSSFLIGTEVFTFSPANIDTVAYKIKSCVRAQKGSSFAAHSINDPIQWLEHDIWLLYGNQGQGAVGINAADVPLLDLANSTNTSWVQTQFYSAGTARPAAWSGQVLSTVGRWSYIFTGNQAALGVDPSTELGVLLADYQVGNIWKAETATISWSLYNPVGITMVSMAGSKFAISIGSWPAYAGLQKILSNGTGIVVWNEAVPGVANTWTAFTHNGVSLGGTYYQIALALSGTLAAQANQWAAIQGDTVTLTLDSTRAPSVTLQAEIASPYYLNCTITNTTTGDYIKLNLTMTLNHTVTVDTRAKTVTLDDGTNLIQGLVLSKIRNNWLPLNVGANVLQFDEPNAAAVTVVTTWQDRSL